MVNNEQSISKKQVEEYYNAFKEQQKKLGINIRHRTIFRNLKKNGLKRNSNVLEIGCGIGTVSSLIINYITKGNFVGVDISEESIEMAKQINSGFKNAQFIVSDMADFTHNITFDFVVLPDVLEHIPLVQHNSLFKILASLTTANAIVLANFPEPNYLNWLRKNYPEKLQIIDQSLSMQDLLNNVYPYGFNLVSMYSYSLQYNEHDYTSIVLKKDMKVNAYTRKSTLILGIENFLSKFY